MDIEDLITRMQAFVVTDKIRVEFERDIKAAEAKFEAEALAKQPTQAFLNREYTI